MKRREESYTAKSIPPVQLFLDDLKQIIELVQIDKPVEITHGEFSYESLDELTANIHRDRLDHLTIAAHSFEPSYSSLTIQIRPGGVRISSTGSSQERRAYVAEILRSKSPWYSWTPASHLWQGVQIVTGLYVPIFFILPLTPQNLTNLNDLPITAILLLLTAIIFSARRFFSDRPWLGGSQIYLHTRLGKPTFWQRNSDNILTNLAVAAVTGITGFVLGKML